MKEVFIKAVYKMLYGNLSFEEGIILLAIILFAC